MKLRSGQVAVITGAGSGIGRGLAISFASAGLDVSLADVDPEGVTQTASSVRAHGAQALVSIVDVGDCAALERFRDETLDRFERIDVVCNNAGVQMGTAMGTWEFDLVDWDWVLRVNLWGVINGVRTFLPYLIDQKEGHMLNTASMSGLAAMPLIAPYVASKYAVVGLSECLLAELSQVAPKVGVSVLCPSSVRSRLVEAERNRPDRFQTESPSAGVDMATLAQGLHQEEVDPLAVGALVLDAIEANQFLILTHRGSEIRLMQRVERLLSEATARFANE